MYSAYKLNKQGDRIQPWRTPFPLWNQSIVLCPILTIASWSAYRFPGRQVRWSSIPISLRIFQFVVIHIAKGFSIISEVEVDAFLEFLCFLCDPTDVGNLIHGSSTFSKSSLYIWKFSVHIQLKLSLKDFDHYLACMWNEHNCIVVRTFFGIALLYLGLAWKLIFFSPLATAEFSKFADILSEALEQHPLLGFEIAQLEWHHLH